MATALGLASAAQVAAPAYACACGAFAPSVSADDPITLNSEQAIVSLADGTEQIDMKLALNSITSDTGLIVPTPTPASVENGSAADFTALAREMTPTQIVKDAWWTTEDGFFGGFGSSAAAPPGSAPTILSQVQLGNLQATTLAATDSTGLTTWLSDNGYGLPDTVTSLLGHYIDQGWSFVAMKLTGDQPLSGDLQPIRFTFASDNFVYPLFLSQAATAAQTVSLYILANHRANVAFMDGSYADDDTTWARAVKDPAIHQRGAYLTAVTMHFAIPSSQITGDLQITPAANDDEVNTTVVVYRYMTVLGIPVGWLLVGFGVVIVALVLVFALLPHRRV